MAPHVLRYRLCVLAGALLAAAADSTATSQEPANLAAAQEFFAQARRAASMEDVDKAVELADLAVAAASESIGARLERARLCDRLRRFDRALDDFDAVIAAVGPSFDLHRVRGGARFKSGDVDAAIADYERAAELDPDRDRELWELGIAYYYAKRFREGAEQFALYQTYYAADVENVVWRFLCEAAADGVEPARAEMMPLEGVDRRVPLMQIDALYRGRGSVEAVLEATAVGDPGEAELRKRLFYAHLYLGMYYTALGDEPLARRHLREALDRRISHYMWDVVNVHWNRLPTDAGGSAAEDE